jgi:hypothetical protein
MAGSTENECVHARLSGIVNANATIHPAPTAATCPSFTYSNNKVRKHMFKKAKCNK